MKAPSFVSARALRSRRPFNGVKVFSATMHNDRAVLGEKVTEWIAAHPELDVVEIVQTQSSDRDFHCVALPLFYFDQRAS